MILVTTLESKQEAKFVRFFMNHKVRSRAPEAPATVEQIELDPPKRGRGRPKGTTSSTEEKLHYPSVCGVDMAKFGKVPPALRNRLASAFAKALSEVSAALQEFYAGGGHDLIAILCGLLPPIVFALGRAIMTELLTEERGHLGQEIGCSCEGCTGRLSYQGEVKKRIKTKMGEINVFRSYYLGKCGHSVCPLDVRLGLENSHSALPDLTELITSVTTSVSFPEAVAFVEKAIPVSVSLRYVEDVTETDAVYVEAKLDLEVEEMKRNPSQAAARNGELKDGVVYASSDGGYCRVRDHTESTHEFKLVCLGLVEAKPGPPPTDPEKYDRMFTIQDKRFVGHLATADAVFEYAQAEYFRCGYHQFKTVHGVADGAIWCLSRISLLAQENQEVSLVLDWFHARERLSAAVALALPEGAERIQTTKTIEDALWDGELDLFFTGLTQLCTDALDKQDEIQEHIDYFAKRRDILRYKECRERKLPIGSGVIEGGIRFLGKDRLDQSGMSWKIKGADGMLGLRCCKYSGRLDEFYKRRDLETKSRYKSAQRQWLSAA